MKEIIEEGKPVLSTQHEYCSKVAKEILLSKYVIAFCDEEKQTGQYLFPINQATKRATDITDRSELLIKKIRREGVCAGDEKLESPEKNRPRELLIIVDDMDRCILKRKIQEFYTVQKEVSTLKLRVFENKVLRKIFGAKSDEVTGEWRKLHNTELHALYSSPDVIRNIKSRRLRWVGHVAEVHGLSVTGSTRRIDIIAFKESKRSGYIIDPTVRFETDEEQPAEVDNEKRISTILSFPITSKIPAKRA
ncbi:hypothetical protein ANN_14352 [Periplaneta americana]|uniref:Uncharacterized protein n=1 Tax=Periplaneta americana TaxID=6978 RepID=A0ABQ8SXN5_PERAM|nr:hypothetical protein ANN_14352 [Periplaneta americana]